MSDDFNPVSEAQFEEWRHGFEDGFSSAFIRGDRYSERERLQCCILEVLLVRFGDPAFSCAPVIAEEHDVWHLEELFKEALQTFSLTTFKVLLSRHADAMPGSDGTAPDAECRNAKDRKLSYAENFGSGFEEGFSEGGCEVLQKCLENFLSLRFGEEAQVLLPPLRRITDYLTFRALFNKILEDITLERFTSLLHYVEEGMNTKEQTEAALLIKKD